MKYHVQISTEAMAGIVAEGSWWGETHSGSQGTRWYNGFVDALQTLESLPGRCALAPESPIFDFDLYEFHYGTGGRPTHRALFCIEGDTVEVLMIRRHSQAPIAKSDFQ